MKQKKYAPNFIRAPNGSNDTTQAIQCLGTLEWMKIGAFEVRQQFGNVAICMIKRDRRVEG